MKTPRCTMCWLVWSGRCVGTAHGLRIKNLELCTASKVQPQPQPQTFPVTQVDKYSFRMHIINQLADMLRNRINGGNDDAAQ